MSPSEERYRHSALGTGHVVASRRGGRELRFCVDDTGLAYWVEEGSLTRVTTMAGAIPREGVGASEAVAEAATGQIASGRAAAPVGTERVAPAERLPHGLPPRAALEALRLGVVPADGTQHFTVGLQREQQLVTNALASGSGSVRFLAAPYGFGKSHALELAAQLALRSGYAVAGAEMDRQEVTLRRPKRIYRALVRNLKLPDVIEEGFPALLSRLEPTGGLPGFGRWVEEIVAQRLFFLAPGLLNYWRAEPGSRVRGEILSYMGGDQVPVGRLNDRSVLRDDRAGSFRPIPDSSTKQGAIAMVRLVGDLARLVRLAGFPGLLVVLDEGEHYRDLTSHMQIRADIFMQNLLGDIEAGDIPHTHLLMAVTPTPDRPDPEWIASRPLFEIAEPTRADVESFVQRFAELYLDAYPDVPRPVAEVLRPLAEALWDSRAEVRNMRMLAKAVVAAWDIVRTTGVSWRGLVAEWT